MQLFYTPRSPYARKVRVVALEKNIALTLIEEDLGKKSPQLLAANPLAKIPALVIDEQQTLFDSPVICSYLDSLNETPTLIPAANCWDVLRWQALADGLMDTTVAFYLEKMRHPQDFNARFIENCEKNSKSVLNYCEQHVQALTELSLASIAVACAVEYVDFRCPQINQPGDYPQLQAWMRQFTQRASMQQTLPVVA